ncbi:MAG: hypothetical protein RL318_1033 [Fibrobacterota bacterium]|jgi:hypothetical protein
MIKTLFAAAAILASASYSASSGQYALGINLGGASSKGKSTGFSGLNFRVGQDESLDMIAAWDPGTIIINGNYLHHVAPVLRQIPVKAIVPYVGIGVGVWMNDVSGAWLQVPLGIDFRFSVPVEAGLYIAPGIDLIPSTNMNMHFGIGVRYWL